MNDYEYVVRKFIGFGITLCIAFDMERTFQCLKELKIMNELLVFLGYEIAKFIYRMFLSSKTTVVRNGSRAINTLILIGAAMVSWVVDVLVYDLLIWLAAQFGIVAASNVAFIVIVIFLNLTLLRY